MMLVFFPVAGAAVLRISLVVAFIPAVGGYLLI